MKESDEECFKWAVIAALEWSNVKFNPEHMSNLRKFADNYHWSGLKFLVAIKDIDVFEMNSDISVNVLSVEGRDVYICKKGQRYLREINLILISEDDRWHYTAIKNLSRLLASKNSKHHDKQHFCMIAYRVLHWSQAEMSIIGTASIMKRLEWRCLVRDRL